MKRSLSPTSQVRRPALSPLRACALWCAMVALPACQDTANTPSAPHTDGATHAAKGTTGAGHGTTHGATNGQTGGASAEVKAQLRALETRANTEGLSLDVLRGMAVWVRKCPEVPFGERSPAPCPRPVRRAVASAILKDPPAALNTLAKMYQGSDRPEAMRAAFLMREEFGALLRAVTRQEKGLDDATLTLLRDGLRTHARRKPPVHHIGPFRLAMHDLMKKKRVEDTEALLMAFDSRKNRDNLTLFTAGVRDLHEGGAAHIKLLKELTKHPHSVVVRAAYPALGGTDASVCPWLADQLKDPRHGGRVATALTASRKCINPTLHARVLDQYAALQKSKKLSTDWIRALHTLIPTKLPNLPVRTLAKPGVLSPAQQAQFDKNAARAQELLISTGESRKQPVQLRSSAIIFYSTGEAPRQKERLSKLIDDKNPGITRVARNSLAIYAKRLAEKQKAAEKTKKP